MHRRLMNIRTLLLDNLSLHSTTEGLTESNFCVRLWPHIFPSERYKRVDAWIPVSVVYDDQLFRVGRWQFSEGAAWALSLACVCSHVGITWLRCCSREAALNVLHDDDDYEGSFPPDERIAIPERLTIICGRIRKPRYHESFWIICQTEWRYIVFFNTLMMMIMLVYFHQGLDVSLCGPRTPRNI
jgi:hypothetical protein